MKRENRFFKSLDSITFIFPRKKDPFIHPKDEVHSCLVLLTELVLFAKVISQYYVDITETLISG